MAIPESKNGYFEEFLLQILEIVGNSPLFYLSFDGYESLGSVLIFFSPHLLVWVGHACVKIMIYVVKMTILHTTAVAQSICTHYSKLSGRPDIFLGSGTLKKSGPKKAGCQKTGSLLFKKRIGSLASSLLE